MSCQTGYSIFTFLEPGGVELNPTTADTTSGVGWAPRLVCRLPCCINHVASLVALPFVHSVLFKCLSSKGNSAAYRPPAYSVLHSTFRGFALLELQSR